MLIFEKGGVNSMKIKDFFLEKHNPPPSEIKMPNSNDTYDLLNTSDEELADKLLRRDTTNLEYKLFLISIALSRILTRLNDPATPKIPPYEP